MSEQKEPVTMRSLERAIDVLEVLEDAGRALRLVDIADRAGLHVATTQRLLGVLEGRGRVERDGKNYRAGVNLIFGAHAYLTTSPLVAASRPVLQELAERTGLTASLFVRTGAHRAVVARVHGLRPLRYELPIGAKLPLHLGAGKTLAADLTPAELTHLLDQVGPMTDAEGRTISPEAFLADLGNIKHQGFQVAVNERQLGSLSVSAPVRSSQSGAVVAAITIGAASEDVSDDEISGLSIEVRRAASAVIVP
ncbi:IclR family transcriptional regulator [Pseudarthrobacter sp. NamE5]|uniref:IclR family transcriptional regulator n=1 Tax=Pseudarthrobacter sp. NamE5 TaxID=2576839 RepID=UPI00110AE555|nr:IclR family transcriptional regulator [Pseudarthrobacter sp. NamE5]TLM88269.1 IclR family transcriptional regulator [Pseudarthrobacter sp. NamE5]